VNCNEFQDHISEAVDRYLKGMERELFDEHARICSHCRSAYHEEVGTKTVVRHRMQLVVTPAAVLAAVLDGLQEEARDATRHASSSWRDILYSPILRPALVVMVLTAVVVTVWTSPDSLIHWSGPISDTDVIQQSLTNYHAAIGGGIVPDVVSSEPRRLEGFFEGKTTFPVLVPALRECTLVGGTLNDRDGMKVAHVLYDHHSRLIYMYQVCLETAMRGEKLSLSGPVRGELERTGWFTQTYPDGDALVLWKRGSTLCAAVAQMDPKDLMSCLTSDHMYGY
jgi:predicted anti-sigma-YlaC factor YlaD